METISTTEQNFWRQKRKENLPNFDIRDADVAFGVPTQLDPPFTAVTTGDTGFPHFPMGKGTITITRLDAVHWWHRRGR